MEEKKLEEETKRKFCACPRAPWSSHPSDVRESRKEGEEEEKRKTNKIQIE